MINRATAYALVPTLMTILVRLPKADPEVKSSLQIGEKRYTKSGKKHRNSHHKKTLTIEEGQTYVSVSLQYGESIQGMRDFKVIGRQRTLARNAMQSDCYIVIWKFHVF